MAKPKIVRRSPVGLAQEGLPEGLTLRREGISVGIRPLPQMASVAPRDVIYSLSSSGNSLLRASARALSPRFAPGKPLVAIAPAISADHASCAEVQSKV